MKRRTVPERVARVEHRLLIGVTLLALGAGWWLAGSLTLLVVVLAAGVVVGYQVRPAAEAVVHRRVSVKRMALSLVDDSDDETTPPAALPPAEAADHEVD